MNFWPSVRDWAELQLLRAGAIPELLDNARINALQRWYPAQHASDTSDASRNWDGKLCVVTGANAGVGLDTSRALASRGAIVIMACRSVERGEAAAAQVRASLDASCAASSGTAPAGADGVGKREGTRQSGSVRFEQLDLAQLSSVRAFARRCGRPPDLVVCNAGIMAPETRQETPDGLEQQFQVNYLSHWLLARELMLPPRGGSTSGRRNTAGCRLLMVTSLTHRGGRLDFNDLQARRRYIPLKSYADSKLAIVMAVRAFQRRFDSAGSGHTAVALDPGVLNTALARDYFHSEVPRPLRPLLRLLVGAIIPWLMLPPATATGTVLWAAAAPAEQVGGRFVKGGRVARAAARACDDAIGERLWRVSCDLTGCSGGGDSSSYTACGVDSSSSSRS